MDIVRFSVNTESISLTEDFSLQDLQICPSLSQSKKEEAVQIAFQNWVQREVKAAWSFIDQQSV